jgi:hypothetical protein
MRRIRREVMRTAVAVAASAWLALVPTFTGAQSQGAADPPRSENAQTGQGELEATTNVRPTGSGADDGTGQTAAEVGDRLHDSAKSFGEAILGGIKYAGRTVIGFFTGDKSK